MKIHNLITIISLVIMSSSCFAMDWARRYAADAASTAAYEHDELSRTVAGIYDRYKLKIADTDRDTLFTMGRNVLSANIAGKSKEKKQEIIENYQVQYGSLFNKYPKLINALQKLME